MPVRFVEDKQPNWLQVQQFMKLSTRAGRWANFGPVEKLLARTVESMLGLPSDRTVVPASSATSALHALVGAYAQLYGRPLTWAISAFGFYSTAIGPLAGRVRVVDCDTTGIIDIAVLSDLPDESWDGLLITDLFGAQPDFSEFAKICAAAGKPMIIDAAVSFPARRTPSVQANEVVSFHHTKPWGFGEGGCAVVDTTLADKVREFINFGVGSDLALASFASNGKMSDIAAAFILQRLKAMPHWAEGYRRQRQRITDLAMSEGLTVLVRPQPDVVAPHIPVLARSPVALSDFPTLSFAIAKYYRPLNSACQVAADLYSRVINVPCHPGMGKVDDVTLRQFFRALPSNKRLMVKARS